MYQSGLTEEDTTSMTTQRQIPFTFFSTRLGQEAIRISDGSLNARFSLKDSHFPLSQPDYRLYPIVISRPLGLKLVFQLSIIGTPCDVIPIKTIFHTAFSQNSNTLPSCFPIAAIPQLREFSKVAFVARPPCCTAQLSNGD